MRAGILLIALSAAHAGVLSRDWENGKLTLQLDDGVAELEWISGTAFRFSHGTASLAVLPQIKHDPIALEFEDTRSILKMRGRYITVEIDKATAKLRVSANDETISTLSVDPAPEGFSLHVGPLGKVFGLAGPEESQRFFFTASYGIFVRAPRECTFDLAHGLIRAHASIDLIFYYGPTPKEIFEQHQTVTGRTEITAQSLRLPSADRLPLAATQLPKTPLDTWNALSTIVRTLNEWSLSAVLYPTLDLSTLGAARGEIAKRASDLAAMLPLLYGDANVHLDIRAAWTPYLVTYLREAYDRGYPLIRPLPVQFSRDKNLDPQPDVFMLGDEVLLAPVVAPGSRRTLKLPRGLWTDLRTNVEYNGNQSIEIDAPPGQVPTFARNGAVLPLAAKTAMELHYFPSLGGEFFLWESSLRENSQFHAAPAGDFTRVEIESKVARTYEWVIHHAKRPIDVEENSTSYKSVRQRSSLKAGTWWHDGARKDLHVMVHSEAGADKIVNISF
jgi:alpha-glucosidase (family GH31 glycosyl hydrolase)